jgi:hypothetical protein
MISIWAMFSLVGGSSMFFVLCFFSSFLPSFLPSSLLFFLSFFFSLSLSFFLSFFLDMTSKSWTAKVKEEKQNYIILKYL